MSVRLSDDLIVHADDDEVGAEHHESDENKIDENFDEFDDDRGDPPSPTEPDLTCSVHLFRLCLTIRCMVTV